MSAPIRILFVDDEPRVRDTLKRLTRPYSNDWDMKFVGSGREALESLDASVFDVLVTDLAMPEMSGPELLGEVVKKYPKLIRIALATMSDQPMINACAASIHQFITRPCESEELHAAVIRALNMEASVRHERVSRLVERMDRLPCLPDLYLRLVDKMQDPECSIDDVAEIVGQDISMTARILKLVNSASFGLRRRVSSPLEAVNYLGIDTVRSLVLSINAFAQFEEVSLGGITLETLWNHSLVTAGFAKVIAGAEGLNGRRVDEAYVSGMLHDAGKLALAANFPAEYAEVVEAAAADDSGLFVAEERILQANHAEVGGHFLGLWGLSGSVVDAVSWHHDPMGCGNWDFGALACVHAADVWSHAGEMDHACEVSSAFYDKMGKSDCLGDWKTACLDRESESVGA